MKKEQPCSTSPPSAGSPSTRRISDDVHALWHDRGRAYGFRKLSSGTTPRELLNTSGDALEDLEIVDPADLLALYEDPRTVRLDREKRRAWLNGLASFAIEAGALRLGCDDDACVLEVD